MGEIRLKLKKKTVYQAERVTLCPHKINKTKTSVVAQQTKVINKKNEKCTFCIAL